MNCHDRRCFVVEGTFFDKIGDSDEDSVSEYIGRLKADGERFDCCGDDASASALSSIVGIVIVIFTPLLELPLSRLAYI